MRQLTALLALCAALLAGCDRVDKLEEGVSTEAQVRQQFGEPVTVTIARDGTRTLDYLRQPEGWTNVVIQIGPDGTMSSLRQLLNPDNFARVKPGLTREPGAPAAGPAGEEHALCAEAAGGVGLALQGARPDLAPVQRHLRCRGPSPEHWRG
jgi:hypothetical protein